MHVKKYRETIGDFKEKQPLISVIVPIFRVEKYLAECIDSIIHQTYRDLEIILVDDGSDDNCPEICDEYEKKDNRINVIHKKNGGIVSARKAGLEIAHGEYVTFVDGDDWIEPNMYEEMISEYTNIMPDIITSGVKRDYENHTVEEYDECPEGYYDEAGLRKYIFPKAMYTGRFFDSGINIHVYNKLFKIDILKQQYKGVDNKINVGEDAAIVFPTVFASKSILILRKAFYHYRIRSGSCMDTVIDVERSKIKILEHCLKKAVMKNITTNSFNYLDGINALIMYLGLLQMPESILSTDKDGRVYPYGQLRKGNKIILYGAGRFGKNVKKIFEENFDIAIVKWVDKNSLKVDEQQKLYMCNFDYVVIAVLKGNLVDDIRNQLICNGIEQNRILTIEI